MRVCADCRQKPSTPERFCACCGRAALSPDDVGSKTTQRLQVFGSLALLVTSVWTGVAGGFGYYARQVGATRAWSAISVALVAIETGKILVKNPPGSGSKSHHTLSIRFP